MRTAFPRCTDMLTGCIRNWNERVSAVVAVMRRPKSQKKASASSPGARRVSTSNII